MDRDLMIQLLNALIASHNGQGGGMYGLPFNIPGSQFSMPQLNPQLPIQPLPGTFVNPTIPQRVDTPPTAFAPTRESQVMANQTPIIPPRTGITDMPIATRDFMQPRRRPEWEVNPLQSYWPPEVLAKLMTTNPNSPKVGGIFPLTGF